MLKDPDNIVQDIAIGALGRIKYPQARQVLLDYAMADVPDRENRLRLGAVGLLGRLGYKPAVLLFLDALENPHNQQDPSFLIGLLEALADLKDVRAIQTVSKFLTHPNKDLRQVATKTIDRLEHPETAEDVEMVGTALNQIEKGD